ncbi:MAG: hypothetical protein M0C28_23350 [Candidatus Moduliflexus flocculans]|nr:hypothetical protein [Candidatus Moduliflexus flocculans]
MEKHDPIRLYFTAPFGRKPGRSPCPSPRGDGVLVRARYSAISAGSESSFSRPPAPGDEAGREPARSRGPRNTPVSYGYSLVGTVLDAGPGADPGLVGRGLRLPPPPPPSSDPAR